MDSLATINYLGIIGVEIWVECKDWSLHTLNDTTIDAVRERIFQLDLAPYSFSLHQDDVYSEECARMTQSAIRMTASSATPFIGSETHAGNGNFPRLYFRHAGNHS
jgi:hypothetical protein